MSLRSHDDYGIKMTIAEFVDAVDEGVFVDHDGTGYFATADGVSDIVARPSTLADNGFPMKYTGLFTHVIWYNK